MPTFPGMAAFHTTRWSMISAAGTGGESAEDAMARLYLEYWKPVYEFVIRQTGCSSEDAKDLVQEFFAETLRKNWIHTADRQRGRFRSFLLTVLKRFLADEWTRQHRAIRNPGRNPTVDWDSAPEITDEGESPEAAFDRRWALTVIEAAGEDLRAEAARCGKAELFETLLPYLNSNDRAGGYREAGSRFHMSEGAVAMAVHRLRTRLRELVRARIATTLADESRVDEELAELIAALR